jgi:hypothetical protein
MVWRLLLTKESLAGWRGNLLHRKESHGMAEPPGFVI